MWGFFSEFDNLFLLNKKSSNFLWLWSYLSEADYVAAMQLLAVQAVKR